MFKVIVAGSRTFNDYPQLKRKLDHILKDKDQIEIVSGKAEGADKLGEIYANEKGYPVKPFPANWNLGKIAGYLRNKEMAEYADACVVFWDGTSPGTKMMIDLAREYNLPLRICKIKPMTHEERLNIIKALHKRNVDGIYGFFFGYRFLSNFHVCDITYEGLNYTSTEAAYQAAKSLDPDVRRRFTKYSPSKSKNEGGLITCREDWPEVKIEIMEELCTQKFTRHEDLKERLLATGDLYLEETNYWKDIFWGVCNGVGENNLGKTLMRIREKIKWTYEK